MYRYIFGPVSSRRLGMSLGVDLVPAKTCSMDCVYCEAGRTTCLTMERKEYVPTKGIISELESCLSKGPALDYITFSGAGEPTLHSGIGEIVKFVKGHYPRYKLCLITNGSLLGDKELAREILPVDLIIPSLDAADDETFRKINRPCSSIGCASFIDSMVEFRGMYRGDLWLEIFVIPGINDNPASVDAIRRAVERIRPGKIQLNSLDRPGAETWVRKATEDEMMVFVKALEQISKVEIIGKPPAATIHGKFASHEVGSLENSVLELVRRRPCTLGEIGSALSMEEDSVRKLLDGMVNAGRIRMEKMERGLFYRV